MKALRRSMRSMMKKKIPRSDSCCEGLLNCSVLCSPQALGSRIWRLHRHQQQLSSYTNYRGKSYEERRVEKDIIEHYVCPFIIDALRKEKGKRGT